MSVLLKRFVDRLGNNAGFNHWCPGCDAPHGIWVEQPNRLNAKWTFNGNQELPTFSPSIRCFHWSKYKEDATPADGAIEITDCHYFIVDGIIRYCGDCKHKLNGQTVPLPAWPWSNKT